QAGRTVELSGQRRRAGAMGLSLPPPLPHGDGHVPGSARTMSAYRIVPLVAALLAFVPTAAAQIPAARDEPALGMEPVHPVMDRPILAHVIFDQLEGRWNGS